MLSKSDTNINLNFSIAFHTTQTARQSREVERTSGIITKVSPMIRVEAGARESGGARRDICTTRPRSVWQAHNFSSEVGCCQRKHRYQSQYTLWIRVIGSVSDVYELLRRQQGLKKDIPVWLVRPHWRVSESTFESDTQTLQNVIAQTRLRIGGLQVIRQSESTAWETQNPVTRILRGRSQSGDSGQPGQGTALCTIDVTFLGCKKPLIHRGTVWLILALEIFLST